MDALGLLPLNGTAMIALHRNYHSLSVRPVKLFMWPPLFCNPVCERRQALYYLFRHVLEGPSTMPDPKHPIRILTLILAYFHLRQLRLINASVTLMQSFITCHLDYRNSMFSGIT